jgi:hypothetical protein
MSLCNCRRGMNRCFFRWGAAIAISRATGRVPEYASVRILCLLGERRRQLRGEYECVAIRL